MVDATTRALSSSPSRVPKKSVEDITALVEGTGRGIAYTRSAYAYLFRRVR
jgi:hypothetical protein